jgi:hypothetical protein
MSYIFLNYVRSYEQYFLLKCNHISEDLLYYFPHERCRLHHFIIHLITVMLVVTDLQMKERLVFTPLLAVCTSLHRQSARWSLDRQGAGLWGETHTSLRILLGGKISERRLARRCSLRDAAGRTSVCKGFVRPASDAVSVPSDCPA